ncbi:translation elongation factor Tu [Encephalitozoon hellem]|uniref:Translation elongation factor EF-1 alpha n=2 Tax=Encephalitozoon hellem TaxID=27973 RepID=A0A9Q9F800_ENCHE|nr:translation elongation factor EF-1 alpha [Encephalitozoon hellem ATCC 50504]AFM98153.1 translation elongation factor EF-1 alpha [Encephalitozoon hellem ATCC 50504]KAG5859922.1 translation elongation factor Tu [Encephalitozoon hellem]UTX42999.1 translation elongation factor EF-1 alpha [Encephalitozoon hellem]WEL38456.1 translation elongation factor EF-1 alpha [Encephalitozoon hellem]|eukprot:XP_003887134.1 translation elongation factor EF-1 alpha [Encephalitozoon hellem ATCC 50504]
MATKIEDDTKPRLNVCFIGHVDSGKSTTVGMLSYQLGAVDKREMEKYEKEAALNNKDTFYLAYLTDKTDAERKRGITITTTLVNLPTEKFNINILDCPGHKDFVKNMVTGASQADVAVVIVPASGFESCIGVGGMLKTHIMISGILGCEKLIICVNKMDEIPEDKREEKFKEVSAEMLRIVKRSHKDKNPIVIPISAFKGINLTKKGESFKWFGGWKEKEGAPLIHTLEEALDYQNVPERHNDKPLRMPITKVCSIAGVGKIFTGRVEYGTITPNLKISIQPAGVVGETRSVEIHNKPRSMIPCGENCGVALKGGVTGDLEKVDAGHVISANDENKAIAYPGAKIRTIVVGRPKGLSPGYTPQINFGNCHSPGRIAKILSKVVGKEVHESPENVANGETFVGIVVFQKPLVVDRMERFQNLAKFALMDSNGVVGIGNVMEPLTREQLLKDYEIDIAEDPKAAKKAASKKKA